MSVEKTKINYLNKRKIVEEQVLVEAMLSAPDVQKVLWVEPEVVLDDTNAQSHEIAFSGQVLFNAVYLDAENKINSSTASVPFMGKVVAEGVSANSKVMLVATPAECEYVSASNKMECVVAVSGDFVENLEAEIVCGGEEDVCAKTEEFTVQELLRQDSLVFTEEIVYPITDKMSNILRVGSRVCLKEIISGENIFTLSGEICTTIKYISSAEEGERIETISFSEPFKREVEANGLSENGKVEAYVAVRCDMFKYELDKETNKIVIEVPIAVIYRMYDTVNMLIATDLFCIKNALGITASSLNKSYALDMEIFENKFEGSVQLEASSPRIDKIMGFSNPTLMVTNVSIENEKLQVEGVITFDFAYFNDELQAVETLQPKVPFKVQLNLEETNGVITMVDVQALEADVVSRRGREVFLDCKIKTCVRLAVDKVDAVISDVEIGEPLPEKKHAIEIYFGKKGDDLWNIAKELRVLPELITQQNPELILPLQQSENIVIYNTKSRQ